MIYDPNSAIFLSFLRNASSKRVAHHNMRLRNSDFSKDSFGDDGRSG